METRLARESEYAAVDALVEGSGLPLDDIDQCRATQYVVADDAVIVATASLEVRGKDAVLRSVAVDADHRGERLGERVVLYAIERARELRLRSLHLLTETAEGFFPRFGFEVVSRDSAPPDVQESVEYCGVCGSHAIAMALPLNEEVV